MLPANYFHIDILYIIFSYKIELEEFENFFLENKKNLENPEF